MSIYYKLGSRGDEVKKLQEGLKTAGFYKGIIDGDFGGGTESAVKAFQKAKKLTADGIVGPDTWKVLFVKEEILKPSIMTKPLNYRCLALSGSYETGKGIPDCFAGISGDFDGQGISFGACQWNFGQGSLQPLLKEMLEKHEIIVKDIFHERFEILVSALNSDKEELMDFARSIQHPIKHVLNEPWQGMFKALGRCEEFQNIQVKYADVLYKSALKLCSDYNLWSERATALMFDVKVQNGSISKLVKTQILLDIKRLSTNLSKEETEVGKMKIIANRRADVANPKWREDVRKRKLCCANGGGIVHGVDYNLEKQFGIRLTQI
ncbi:MAG: peptidoglycan-binding domain-containing protein [bacterium]|nr:peptidoglycan-binding domain-containing protein [bacterium]